jgi:hypothetical protein
MIKDLNKPEFIKNFFTGEKKINFGWKECEDALNKSIFYKNLEIIDNVSKSKVQLSLLESYWFDKILDIKEISNLISVNSFVLLNMSAYNNSLSSVCGYIENQFNCQADVHIYGGLNTHCKSFKIHNDSPNNLIVQLEGTCEWFIYNERINHSINLDSDENLTLVIKTVLEPGDAIFIPKNQLHRCNPLSKRISASIPFFGNFVSKRGWINLEA